MPGLRLVSNGSRAEGQFATAGDRHVFGGAREPPAPRLLRSGCGRGSAPSSQKSVARALQVRPAASVDPARLQRRSGVLRERLGLQVGVPLVAGDLQRLLEEGEAVHLSAHPRQVAARVVHLRQRVRRPRGDRVLLRLAGPVLGQHQVPVLAQQLRHVRRDHRAHGGRDGQRQRLLVRFARLHAAPLHGEQVGLVVEAHREVVRRVDRAPGGEPPLEPPLGLFQPLEPRGDVPQVVEDLPLFHLQRHGLAGHAQRVEVAALRVRPATLPQ
jgi:hypothetical protein